MAIGRLAETPHVLLNAPLVGQRLGTPDVSGLDLLELFAFVFPARFAVPTVAGMARSVGIAPPASDGEAAPVLLAIAAALLDDPPARAALAARAQAVAEEKYSRESYLRRTAQAYARLASGAPGQASTSIPVAGR